MGNRTSVFVEFSIAGSEFANSNELDTRNAIIEALDACGFGEFIGAGSGLECVDFSYWVDDEAKARKTLAEVIGRLSPQATYSADFSTSEDDDDPDEWTLEALRNPPDLTD